MFFYNQMPKLSQNYSNLKIWKISYIQRENFLKIGRYIKANYLLTMGNFTDTDMV